MLSRWKLYWCTQTELMMVLSQYLTFLLCSLYTIALNLLCLFLYQIFSSFWITLSKVIALQSITIAIVVAFLLLEAIVIRKRFLFIFAIALKRVKDGQLSLTKKWKSDNCIGSNTARKEVMNQNVQKRYKKGSK